MNVQIDGKSLAEFAPEAAKYIDASEAVLTLGLAALVRATGKGYEARIAWLEGALKKEIQANEELRTSNATLAANIETVQAKLSRPRAGRVKTTGRLRREVPDDADPTTKELMNEAYSGKQPHSKSEMRRQAVMKESKK